MIPELIGSLPSFWTAAMDLIKHLQESRSKREIELRCFFDERIEPVYAEMVSIHKDYEDGLGKLLSYLRERSRPPFELLAWFLERGRLYRAERISLQNIETEIAHSPLRNKLQIDAKTDLDFSLLDSIENFPRQIIEYFENTHLPFSFSFYTDFANGLDLYVRYGQSSTNRNEGLAGAFYDSTHVQDMIRDLEIIVQRTLPRRWDRFTRAYREVRGHCLQ